MRKHTKYEHIGLELLIGFKRSLHHSFVNSFFKAMLILYSLYLKMLTKMFKIKESPASYCPWVVNPRPRKTFLRLLAVFLYFFLTQPEILKIDQS